MTCFNFKNLGFVLTRLSTGLYPVEELGTSYAFLQHLPLLDFLYHMDLCWWYCYSYRNL